MKNKNWKELNGMKTIIQSVPNCEKCDGQTEWYQPNFAYQCHFCGHIGKINKQHKNKTIKPNKKILST